MNKNAIEELNFETAAFQDWLKTIPNQEVVGFAEKVNQLFDIPINVDRIANPREFAESLYKDLADWLNVEETKKLLEEIVQKVNQAL